MIRPIPFSLAQARYDSQEQECWRDEELDLARKPARCACGRFMARNLERCQVCERNQF